MEQTYFVYAGDRGFWGRSGQYVTDLAQAKVFTHEQALDFCRRRFATRIEGFPALPVTEADARAVSTK